MWIWEGGFRGGGDDDGCGCGCGSGGGCVLGVGLGLCCFVLVWYNQSIKSKVS